jgi:hypothetical protein
MGLGWTPQQPGKPCRAGQKDQALMVVFPGINKTQAATALPGRRRVGTAGAFALPGEAHAPAELASGGVAGLPGLLALQEAGDTAATAAAQDKAACRHGEAVMDDLRELQLAMLSGGTCDLSGLAARAGAGPQAADPRLAAVIGAIRLRASVELARAAMRPESDIKNPSATRR